MQGRRRAATEARAANLYQLPFAIMPRPGNLYDGQTLGPMIGNLEGLIGVERRAPANAGSGNMRNSEPVTPTTAEARLHVVKIEYGEDAMKASGFAIMGVLGLAATSWSYTAQAEEQLVTLKATSGRLLHAGLYPSYYVFLKGVDPATKTNWVDKSYRAVLDIEEGPEKGKSVVIDLIPTTQASPNPEWCDTEGGEKFSGGGVTCRPESTSKEQLRYRVRVLRSDDLPKAFAGRTIAEYPTLPGRRENETLGPFEMKILLQE